MATELIELSGTWKRMKKNNFDDVIALLSEGSSIIIATHSNPDGDTIGSAIALKRFLSLKGKKVVIYNESEVPFNLKFLLRGDEILNKVPDEEFDIVLLLDVGDLERVSDDFEKNVKYGKSIVIDHHLTTTEFGDITVIDPSAAATGVLVYKLLKKWDVDAIDKTIAEPLYTAIFTDTGSFRFSNTDPEALRVASELLEYGISPDKIASEIYENMPFERVRLISAALSTLTIAPNGSWAYIVVTRDLLARVGATPDMLEDIINYVRGIRGVKVAMQFREIGEKQFKVGFRSKDVDVEEIARFFGGGGHKNASGCKMEGDYLTVIRKVISEVEKRLKNAG